MPGIWLGGLPVWANDYDVWNWLESANVAPSWVQILYPRHAGSALMSCILHFNIDLAVQQSLPMVPHSFFGHRVTARLQREEPKAKAKAKQMPKAAAPPAVVPVPPWRLRPAAPAGPPVQPGLPAQPQADAGPVAAAQVPEAVARPVDPPQVPEAVAGPVDPPEVSEAAGPVDLPEVPEAARPADLPEVPEAVAGPVDLPQVPQAEVGQAAVEEQEGSAWDRRVLGRALRRALQPEPVQGSPAQTDGSQTTESPSFETR